MFNPDANPARVPRFRSTTAEGVALAVVTSFALAALGRRSNLVSAPFVAGILLHAFVPERQQEIEIQPLKIPRMHRHYDLLGAVNLREDKSNEIRKIALAVTREIAAGSAKIQSG